MKIKWMLGMGAGAAALLAAGEYALARYFLRRTLMREGGYKADPENGRYGLERLSALYGGKPPVVFKPAP